MVAKEIVVNACWDAEAEVWTARSDDVPGLALEAATVELLRARLKLVVPELLELNGFVPDQNQPYIPLSLLTQSREQIAL